MLPLSLIHILGAAAGKRHIISTQIEHHAVLHTLQALQAQGFTVTLLPPSAAGLITGLLYTALRLADEENRRQIALACSQSGWSEGAALTLGGQRPRRQKTYDFDDL